jgi:hypothetical protein
MGAFQKRSDSLTNCRRLRVPGGGRNLAETPLCARTPELRGRYREIIQICENPPPRSRIDRSIPGLRGDFPEADRGEPLRSERRSHSPNEPDLDGDALPTRGLAPRRSVVHTMGHGAPSRSALPLRSRALGAARKVDALGTAFAPWDHRSQHPAPEQSRRNRIVRRVAASFRAPAGADRGRQ